MDCEELIALPENGAIEYTEAPDPNRPGIMRRTYHVKPAFAMSFKKTDVALFYDEDGCAWCTGWIDGVLHKSRLRGLDHGL